MGKGLPGVPTQAKLPSDTPCARGLSASPPRVLAAVFPPPTPALDQLCLPGGDLGLSDD